MNILECIIHIRCLSRLLFERLVTIDIYSHKRLSTSYRPIVHNISMFSFDTKYKYMSVQNLNNEFFDLNL